MNGTADRIVGSYRWLPGLLVVLVFADAAVAQIDASRLEAAGIRRLEGRHLTLYTDLSADPAVDSLVDVFDQAYPQWCRYFGLDETTAPVWHMTGYLMSDRRRFESLEMVPPDLPEFRHGYSVGHELWLYDQPTDYYRRHLLLHEGTHGFMNTRLSGAGSPWYMESVAERLATHSLEQDRLNLRTFPDRREDVPMLARIALVQDAVAAGRRLQLDDVRGLPGRAFLHNEAYAWAWAAAAFLDGHPAYRDRFRQLIAHVRSPRFDAEFDRLFEVDRRQCELEWAMFVDTLVHGHDLDATAVDFTPGQTWQDQSRSVEVRADRGWQNTGLKLEAGRTYEIRAKGRYQVADEPRVWWCEPGGVSIRYVRGKPLGMLLAAVYFDDVSTTAPTPTPEDSTDGHVGDFLNPTPIGRQATLAATRGGTLYLRINDSPGELHDNAGTLQAEIVAR